MSIFVGDQKATHYHGDHHPAELWGPDPKGEKLVRYAGFDTPKVSGQGRVELGTQPYNASLPSVTVHGEGKQDKLEGRNLLDLNRIENGTFNENTGAPVDVRGQQRTKYAIRMTPGQKLWCYSSNVSPWNSRLYIFKVTGEYIETYGLRKGAFYTAKQECDVRLVSNGSGFTGGGSYLAMFMIGPELLPYEPYCGGVPAPNPQYPIEPVFLEGASVVGRGRNLFDPSVKHTYYENVISYWAPEFYTSGFRATPNVNYVVHTKNNMQVIDVRTFSDNRRISAGYGVDNVIFTVSKPEEIYFYIQGSEELTPEPATLSIDYPTPYTPYYDGGTAPLPILRALPDGSVRDEMDVVSGTVVRRIGELIFDERIPTDTPKGWNKNRSSGVYESFYVLKEPFNAKEGVNNNNLCSHALYAVWDPKPGNFFWEASASFGLRIDKKYLGDDYDSLVTDRLKIGRFVEWLTSQKDAGTPVKVWYALKDPIIEHYDPAILRQHPGYTQLIQQGGFREAEIEAEYYKEVNG